MKLSTALLVLVSSSMFALTGCGTSVLGGGSSGDPGGSGAGGAGGGGDNTCGGERSPVSCTKTGCAAGEICVPDTSPDQCYPFGCDCEDGTWLCTLDCGNGSRCIPEPPACDGFPSPVSCAETGCPAGQTCRPDADKTVCHPSVCTCDGEHWVCTADCHMEGSSCVPDVETCEGQPNPVSCATAGCPAGQTCTPDPDPNACHPSMCTCGDGGWSCTKDCAVNGSICVTPL